MAELNRAASFAKTFNRRAGRAKELLRQNLGKGDKTKDEDFDEYVKNFNKQSCSSTKLLKEVKNYHNCLKAMQAARKSLMDVICDLYDESWSDCDMVQLKAEILDRRFEEYREAINENVIKDIITYSELFPEVNKKILKRRNKLLDYDRFRHVYESLEQNPKKKENAKTAAAREQMVSSQMLYETINKELHDELPALYDSRITFLASHLQSLFHAERTYHSDTSVIFSDLSNFVDKLTDETRKSTKRLSDEKSENSETKDNGIEGVSSSEYVSTHSEVVTASSVSSKSEDLGISEISLVSCEEDQKIISTESELSGDSVKAIDTAGSVKTSEKLKPTSKYPAVLYQVKAAYSYTAEDADELSFETDDLINVIEFEDPEEQEEGWLMGYIGDPKVKGLFPSNFTKPI